MLKADYILFYSALICMSLRRGEERSPVDVVI